MRFKDLHTSILLESAKDRYLAMFAEPHFHNKTTGDVHPVVAQNVQWAMTNLKKEDWVVWFLRKFKVYDWCTHGDKAELMASKWFKEFRRKGGYDATYNPMDGSRIDSEFNTPSIQHFMKHYLDMMPQIPKMRDVVFGWQEWGEIQQTFDAIETEWRGDIDADDNVVDEYGEKVMEFDDGFAWYDLKKAGCSIESKAMGHCGNGYDRPSDRETILSLRKRLKSNDPAYANKLTPTLTFIMHSGGILGEMKGRANDKPAARYHKYILALLKSDLITKISGGGYKPENNFAISDLSAEAQKDLYATKPNLFDLYSIYQFEGPGDKFITKAKETLGAVSVSRSVKNADGKYASVIQKIPAVSDAGVVIGAGNGVEALGESLELKNLKQYAEWLENGYMDGDSGASKDYDKLAEVLIDLLKSPSEHRKNSARSVITYLESEYEERIEDNDYDLSDRRDLSSLMSDIEDDDETMGDIAYRCNDSAYETGAYRELEEAYDKVLKNNNVIQEEGPDSEWQIRISMDEFGQWLKRVKEDEYNQYDDSDLHIGVRKTMIEDGDVFKDLDVPYYGFSGFDEEAYIERLMEEIGERDVFNIDVDENS